MIIGIGIDIVEINRISQLISRFGYKFLIRNFSNIEIKEAQKINFPTKYYAKRFAAKEAFSKAIGTGIRKNISFKDISTLNNKLGAPYIILKGHAKLFINKISKNIYNKNIKIHISLTDEQKYAQAFVILEI